MLPIEVCFKPRGKWWLACAPEIDVCTQGKTFEEAQQNIREAIQAFVEYCLERGTLDQVLAEAGFSKVKIRSFRRAVEGVAPQPHQECRA